MTKEELLLSIDICDQFIIDADIALSYDIKSEANSKFEAGFTSNYINIILQFPLKPVAQIISDGDLIDVGAERKTWIEAAEKVAAYHMNTKIPAFVASITAPKNSVELKTYFNLIKVIT